MHICWTSATKMGQREDAAARRSVDPFLQRGQPTKASFQDREFMEMCYSRMDAAAPLTVLLGFISSLTSSPSHEV